MCPRRTRTTRVSHRSMKIGSQRSLQSPICFAAALGARVYRKGFSIFAWRFKDCILYEHAYACTYVLMCACTYVRMCVCMHACMHAWMYVCMYVCDNVYTYTELSIDAHACFSYIVVQKQHTKKHNWIYHVYIHLCIVMHLFLYILHSSWVL